jgi:hypothetical protein
MGYVYIGMDHFALPTDELASAQAQRNLPSHEACGSLPTTVCGAT